MAMFYQIRFIFFDVSSASGHLYNYNCFFLHVYIYNIQTSKNNFFKKNNNLRFSLEIKQSVSPLDKYDGYDVLQNCSDLLASS